MNIIRKTITFTQQQSEWIKSRINAGDYASDSEYVRDLIRRDQQKQTQQRNTQLKALKEAMQTGLDSGVSNKNVLDIMQEVETKLAK